MEDALHGRVAWIFEDHFDVDLIVGVHNIKVTDPEHLLTFCMQDYDPDFAAQVRPGDILVGGRNFGYGHPHYPPLIAMRRLGIHCVVAESFSPGFWRGEIYNGVVLITCPGISQAVSRWDTLEVRWKEGWVHSLSTGQRLRSEVPDERTVQVIEAGGYVPYLKRTWAGQQAAAAPAPAG